MERTTYERAFQAFSQQAPATLKILIAPGIVGMDEIKEAAALQLFAKEPIHILLLGDPGTGKTEILRAIEDLAPVASFGLGSGTSGAGLAVTVKGKEVSKGLLPLADNGICCIDELNLMKHQDMASLYNAMEKGFITYNKGSDKLRFDARVRVLATANPKGDRFVGNTPDTIQKQLPFESALLSRFHLAFIVRKPTSQEFVQITRSIVTRERKAIKKTDAAFLKRYVANAESLDVEFSKAYEPAIVGFIEDIAKDEKDFITDVSPRLVIGIIRLAKACARMRLSATVDKTDIKTALRLLKSSLYWRKKT
ncbi:MAG: hypothetical protein HC945_00235 [Nitrosarchaeum sp.]|nr:hypothetical protein [Nitrosarchaeum sp.]